MGARETKEPQGNMCIILLCKLFFWRKMELIYHWYKIKWNYIYIYISCGIPLEYSRGSSELKATLERRWDGILPLFFTCEKEIDEQAILLMKSAAKDPSAYKLEERSMRLLMAKNESLLTTRFLDREIFVEYPSMMLMSSP